MTRVLVVTETSLRQAGSLIRNGGVVVYPTDTVYGLGCDPFNPQAVERLVKAKRRKTRPLPLLVRSLEIGKKIGTIDRQSLALAQRFWPGPLTIIVTANTRLPEAITGSANTVGLRMPNRTDTLELIEEAGGVLVGTSANITGQKSARSASDVMAQLGGKVDLILDGGPSPSGRHSTVVRVENGRVVVVRESAIPKETITVALNRTGSPES